MARAQASGVRMTDNQRSVAKGMVLRGDRVQDVASFFHVNSGRISTIAKDMLIVPAKPNELPPTGPYPSPATLFELRTLEAGALLENMRWHMQQTEARLRILEAENARRGGVSG